MPDLVELGENPSKKAFSRLERPPKYEVKTEPRRRPENVKERIVRERGFDNLRLEFAAFRQAMVQLPAQIVLAGRRIVYRLLSWNPWQQVLFRLLDQLRLPMRC